MTMKVDETGRRDQSSMTWDCIMEDMINLGLQQDDAWSVNTNGAGRFTVKQQIICGQFCQFCLVYQLLCLSYVMLHFFCSS